MIIGGSELPKALARQALALGVDVYAGYGNVGEVHLCFLWRR